MNLQTSTLAERVSDFFKSSLEYVRYAAANAAGAAVIALSSGAAAQTPPAPATPVSDAPAPAAPAPAPAVLTQAPTAPADAPRRYIEPELQARVNAFKEICANPTYMGWLTRYAVSCVDVDEERLQLRLETPVRHPDRQEKRQWELYKFGDVVDNFDFLINAETKNVMARGVADLHNNAVRARNRNAPASDLLDPSLIDIVSAGANGEGGSRFEVVYDLDRHKQQYKIVGAPVTRRVKKRYGLNTPVWKHRETLVLDVKLLQYVDVQGMRARIDSEQQIQASALQMYGSPGTVVFEKVDPADGSSLGVFEANNNGFELPPGVYIPRSREARNFTPFVDIDGDRKNDLNAAFDFLADWQGNIRVRNQYTGAERISPGVRRSIEGKEGYSVRVTSAPAAGAPTAEAADVSQVGRAAPTSGTGTPAPETDTPPGTGTPAQGADTPPEAAPAAPPGAPPAEPPTLLPAPQPTPPAPLTPLQQINAEAAGMFARLGPHFNATLQPGYRSLMLVYDFRQNRMSADSGAAGPTIAGSIGGIVDDIAWNLAFDYFVIKDGSGTVMSNNDMRVFTYDGALKTLAAEVGYARLLFDNRNESNGAAQRRNLYLGVRAEQVEARIDGTNITANTQTTEALLAVGGLDLASASLDEMDHALRFRVSGGLNNQSNSQGIDYDAGFSARIAGEYLGRLGRFAVNGGFEAAYAMMSTEGRERKQERGEKTMEGNFGLGYLLGDERRHRVGAGFAVGTMQAENSENGTSQVSEQRPELRFFLNFDLAF